MTKAVGDKNETAPEIEIGNLVNEILLAHKDVWGGNDEIQDMVAEAFVKGIKWERDRGEPI